MVVTITASRQSQGRWEYQAKDTNGAPVSQDLEPIWIREEKLSKTTAPVLSS